MTDRSTTPEPEEPTRATPDPTPGSADETPSGGWSADPGDAPRPGGRFDLVAVFTAVTDAVVSIAHDVSSAAGPALHDAAVKAGPGVRETAARAADVAAKAADAAGPIAVKVAGATGDAGHKLADRSRGLAADLRSMSPIPPTEPVDGTSDPASGNGSGHVVDGDVAMGGEPSPAVEPSADAAPDDAPDAPSA